MADRDLTPISMKTVAKRLEVRIDALRDQVNTFHEMAESHHYHRMEVGARRTRDDGIAQTMILLLLQEVCRSTPGVLRLTRHECRWLGIELKDED